MLSRSPRRTHNLPAHRVRLIGRERDLAFARQSLMERDGRLLTLTGTGGCGKTLLAIELADELVHVFDGGVWLVELALVSDSLLLAQTVLAALGLRERPRQELTDTVAAEIGDRPMLLLLDNCEHQIEACAALVERLLDRCPRLRILATSREAPTRQSSPEGALPRR